MTSAKTSVAAVKENVSRSAKRHLHAILPAMAALMVLAILFMGQPERHQSSTVPLAFSGGLGGVATVDEYSSAQIAADIAKDVDLIVADNVQNLADSQKARIEFAVTEGSYLAKPQQVVTDDKSSREIITYVVKSGDTIPKIARQFNITSDTIRWENSLTGDLVAVGTRLRILPVSGVRYTVQSGDTAEGIAEHFGLSSSAFLVAFNDAELDGFKTGDKIIVPNGRQPQVQPTYFSSGFSGFAFGSDAIYGGNGYSYGYCTWHVANRRAQIGRAIPRNLGNAITWKALASIAGYSVDRNPRAGDVAWYATIGGLGHVGFVEKVNTDGSIVISDMNYPIWNVVTSHTVKPSEFSQYYFIH